MPRKKKSKKKVCSTTIKKPPGSFPYVRLIIDVIAVWGVLLTTIVTCNPKVLVYPSAILDKDNPSFTAFTINNQGYLSIWDVSISSSIKYLKYPGDITVIGLGEYDNRFYDPKQVAHVIKPTEQYTEILPFTGMEHNNFLDADIAIVLNYRPFKWLPYKRETLHRFVTKQDKDGIWHWFQEPIGK